MLREYFEDKNWIWLNREVMWLIEGRGNKKLYPIDLSTVSLTYWNDLKSFKKYLERLPRFKLKDSDRILLIVKNEALPNYQWKEIIDCIILLSGKSHRDIMVVDIGSNTDGSYNHVTTNPFALNPCLDLASRVPEYIPLDQRKTFYNSLSRNQKNFRVLFTLELIKRNLLDIGSVSCCVSNDYISEEYRKIIPDEYQKYFPMYASGIVNRNRYINSYPSSAIDSIVKVVLETTFDDVTIPGTDQSYCGGSYSDRIVITEKTFFGYQAFQVPIFLTVCGHVTELKKYGFDMFEDIVDHSYDTEIDPDKRIKMVADELERLSKNKSSIINAKNIEERLMHNRSNVITMGNEVGKNLKEKLLEWFNSD